MKPIEFDGDGKATVFAANQPEYQKLPARKHADGRVTTMWELSDQERVDLASGGLVQLDLLTFNNPLQPVVIQIVPVTEPITIPATLSSHDMALALGQIAAKIVNEPGNLKHWHLARTDAGEIHGLYVEL
jgi:hypothetical protein